MHHMCVQAPTCVCILLHVNMWLWGWTYLVYKDLFSFCFWVPRGFFQPCPLQSNSVSDLWLATGLSLALREPQASSLPLSFFSPPQHSMRLRQTLYESETNSPFVTQGSFELSLTVQSTFSLCVPSPPLDCPDITHRARVLSINSF